MDCLTTSQFVTAPKLLPEGDHFSVGLTTSQFVTAPKPLSRPRWFARRLTTSQFVTAPKRKMLSEPIEKV